MQGMKEGEQVKGREDSGRRVSLDLDIVIFQCTHRLLSLKLKQQQQKKHDNLLNLSFSFFLKVDDF